MPTTALNARPSPGSTPPARPCLLGRPHRWSTGCLLALPTLSMAAQQPGQALAGVLSDQQALSHSLAWASAAGAAPLTVYAAGLLLATVLAFGLVRLVRLVGPVGPVGLARQVQPTGAPSQAVAPGHAPAGSPPDSVAVAAPAARAPREAWRLAARLGLAAAVLLLAGAGITAVGGQIAPQGAVGRWDDAFSAAMAPQRSPALLAVFAALSHAGDARVVTAIGVVVALALWRAQHRLLAAAWAAALVGNGLFTRLFKAWWARDRPLHEHGLAVVSGHSFPSGHASASAVACLWLACLGCWLLPSRWRLPVAVLACATAWTVAFSRVVLNVHYASDVLSGLLLGSAWALASGLAVRGVLRWQHTGPSASAGACASPHVSA